MTEPNNSDNKILAISTIVAGILANQENLEDLCNKKGAFTDPTEVALEEAFYIYKVIKDNS